MATIPASENEFPEVLFAEGAAPAAPGTGLVKAYAKSDGLLYSKDDAGAESVLGASAHIADTSDAHDASAISIADAGALYTATDVEAALAEVMAAVGAGGIPATIVDTKGDIIAATAADTVDNLAAGANGSVLEAQSGEATGLKWWKPASASYRRAPGTGDYTTTSTSFTNMDGTNLALAITTGARRVAVSFTAFAKQSNSTFSVYVDVDLDGTRLGNGDGGIVRMQAFGNGAGGPVGFVYVTDVLSAGAHTFTWKWRVDGNTGTILNTGTDTATVVRAAVVELFS